MAYRSGTYVAFHAGGTSDPIASDIKYYRMLTAWHEHDAIEFRLIDSHEKSSAVRDSSSRERLRAVLAQRLRNSKNMVLIIGATTRSDTDWVPYEIQYAVDTCGLPIIAAYPGLDFVVAPMALSYLWPAALAARIHSGSAHVIHVPFKREPLRDAISQFSPDNYPVGQGLTVYSAEAYREFGIRLP